MTAVTNIRYYKSNVYHRPSNDSVLALVCRAIGAKEYSITSLVSRFSELRHATTPTVIEINGIESQYEAHKSQIDNLFKFLSAFSKKHRLVKFTVKLGEMVYVL